MSTNSSPTREEENVSEISPNEEDIHQQLANDLMTCSYTEISFESEDNSEKTDIELGEELETSSNSCQTNKLSSSLSLPQLSSTIVKWSQSTKQSYETENLNFTQNVKEVPDFISNDGLLVSYVTQDFENKLKQSNSFEGHCSQQSERNEIKILNNLEKQTKKLSNNINSMLRHISESTHNITSLTVECISTYETCLNKTCDVIDSNIKSMYQLMAKCEELNQSMKPINSLSEELKEVKRVLELFEKAVEYRM